MKRTTRSVIVTDVAREPLGDGLDRALRGRVAGLVDVAVTGAGLEVEHAHRRPLRASVAAKRLARRAQFVAFADHDERRREPVAVTESGERLRIR